MKNIRQYKLIVVAGLLGAAFGFVATGAHLGCKQGEGADVRRGLFGAIGSVTGQSQAFEGANIAMDTAGSLIITPEDEDNMGQAVAVSLTNSSKLTTNKQLSQYVSFVGLTLVESSPRPVGNWVFGVLESNEVNAFAGPNGYIFVTTGALRRMQDESELAGVLAHELTHVLHHHGVAGVELNAVADAMKRGGSLAAGGRDMGLINSVGGPVSDVVIRNGYDKNAELDADKNAITLVVAAGYDPEGLVRFLEKLESAGGDLMSTHPGKADRIAKARAQIAKLGNPQGKTLKERFARNVVLR